MPKRVVVTVNDRGEIRTDFVGFQGDECLDEAERLSAILKNLGLRLGVQEIRRKSPAETEREAGTDETGEERGIGTARR